MNVLRGALLAASQNEWLREHAMRSRPVRRAVSRFMPGESLDDALAAAAVLRDRGLTTILTQLGENVTESSEAEAVTEHYLQVLERVRGAGLDAEVSVKLTQLGLDAGREPACRNLERIARRAGELGNRVFVDMESSAYTEATVEIFRRVRDQHGNVGLCLQAYLRRTSADVDDLLRLGPSIRLVKGAYREPAEIAFQSRREVDRSFLELASRLLDEPARRAGAGLVLGTHDLPLLARFQAAAEARGASRQSFEIAMLYGIQNDAQQRLARDGFRVRVLISYGSHWFPWYMRRLAERPGNVLFVFRNYFGG
jgi:proline dehydrogenase